MNLCIISFPISCSDACSDIVEEVDRVEESNSAEEVEGRKATCLQSNVLITFTERKTQCFELSSTATNTQPRMDDISWWNQHTSRHSISTFLTPFLGKRIMADCINHLQKYLYIKSRLLIWRISCGKNNIVVK